MDDVFLQIGNLRIFVKIINLRKNGLKQKKGFKPSGGYSSAEIYARYFTSLHFLSTHEKTKESDRIYRIKQDKMMISLAQTPLFYPVNLVNPAAGVPV